MMLSKNSKQEIPFYYQSYTKKRDNQFLLLGVIHFFGGSKFIILRFWDNGTLK